MKSDLHISYQQLLNETEKDLVELNISECLFHGEGKDLSQTLEYF